MSPAVLSLNCFVRRKFLTPVTTQESKLPSAPNHAIWSAILQNVGNHIQRSKREAQIHEVVDHDRKKGGMGKADRRKTVVQRSSRENGTAHNAHHDSLRPFFNSNVPTILSNLSCSQGGLDCNSVPNGGALQHFDAFDARTKVLHQYLRVLSRRHYPPVVGLGAQYPAGMPPREVQQLGASLHVEDLDIGVVGA